MILPIYTYGQPVLRKVAEDIDADYPELKELIQNMFETNERADGVGLAAPQIGLPIRVVIVDLRPLALAPSYQKMESLSFFPLDMLRIYQVTQSQVIQVIHRYGVSSCVSLQYDQDDSATYK